MNKVWLEHYDRGVTPEVNLEGYTSLADYIEKSCKKFADLPAFSNLNHVLTYAQIDQRSCAFAAFLQQKLGLKKGDRFAIMLPNLLQYIIAMFGALRAGLIVVNVNPLYTARELSHQLQDSGAKGLLVLANFAHVAQTALQQTQVQHVIVTEIGDALSPIKAGIVNFVVKYLKKMVPAWQIDGHVKFRTVLSEGANLTLAPVHLELTDMAYLQYTGGTTGVSKGATLTHGNMISNIMQLIAWVRPYLDTKRRQLMVTALPLYHVFSLTVSCWLFLQEGVKNVLITNPRDIAGFVREIMRLKFTAMIGVNTLFNELINNPDFAKVDFSELRYVISGGMALQRAVADKWQAITGVHIAEGYGLTEASPVVSCTPLRLKEFTGSIGLPIPSTECAIMQDGVELPMGSEGELCVRGPQVMQGYWQSTDATAKVLSKDGWLRTGDIARMDENGYIFIVDRQKNMIVVSGLKVYPNEIEEVVSQIPGVLEVAAIGIPDERTGERVKLFVVKKDSELTKQQIIDYCYTELTRYKVPKDIEFRDSLPKSNVGKILHRVLRDEEKAKTNTAHDGSP